MLLEESVEIVLGILRPKPAAQPLPEHSEECLPVPEPQLPKPPVNPNFATGHLFIPNGPGLTSYRTLRRRDSKCCMPDQNARRSECIWLKANNAAQYFCASLRGKNQEESQRHKRTSKFCSCVRGCNEFNSYTMQCNVLCLLTPKH